MTVEELAWAVGESDVEKVSRENLMDGWMDLMGRIATTLKHFQPLPYSSQPPGQPPRALIGQPLPPPRGSGDPLPQVSPGLAPFAGRRGKGRGAASCLCGQRGGEQGMRYS